MTDTPTAEAAVREQCAEIAATFSHHALWFGLHDFPMTPEMFRLGEGLAQRIADAIREPAPIVAETPAVASGVREALEWLRTEVSAIDCVYRGDPSYEHDAYWAKDRFDRLITDCEKAFAAIPSPAPSPAQADVDAAVEVMAKRLKSSGFDPERYPLADMAKAVLRQI